MRQSGNSPARRGAPVGETLRRLHLAYPEAACSLTHQDPLQLLIATILSAQCTDARVNMVTPALFRRFPDARALAAAPEGELEDLIRSTGFFNSKAKSIRGAAKAIVERYGGAVPTDMDALVSLPGVGRKTANVVLGNCGYEPGGVVVDTHVGRISRRLGWTAEEDPEKVETALNALVPKPEWVYLAHALIEHGRALCTARAPKCPLCPLDDVCPKVGVEAGIRAAAAGTAKPAKKTPRRAPRKAAPKPKAAARRGARR